MNALILAAGYGTRLAKDISEAGPAFQHLLGLPKSLLPIGGQPLLTRWMNVFREASASSRIPHVNVFVVINDCYKLSFEEWAQDFPDVKLVSDGSTSNETRLGALGAMQLALDHFSLCEADTVVIGGDTLFSPISHSTRYS